MALDTERKYYVYEWIIKETGEVFYIGKGTGKRYLTRKRENKFFMNMLNSHNCESRIIKDNLNEKEAFDLEIELIAYHRQHSPRLTNIADGGDNPPKMYGERNAEWNKHIGEAIKKYYENNPQARKESSDRLKRYFETDDGKEFRRKSLESRQTEQFRNSQREKCIIANNKPEYIKKHSKLMKEIYQRPEVRENLAGENNPRATGVIQFDLDGNYIAEYRTMTESEQITGIKVARISASARGERKTGGGYVWRYLNEHRITHKKKNYGHANESQQKAIMQYDKNGNFIREYTSIADATRINDYKNHSNIVYNLKGKTKSAYGYVWKYK